MAIALCLGCIFTYARIVYGVSWRWLWVLLPLAITPFFFFLHKGRFIKTLCAVTALAVFFFIGVFSLQAKLTDYRDCGAYEGEYTVVGRVAEKNDYGEYALLILDDLYIGNTKEDGKAQVYLSSDLAEEVRLSDEVLLVGTVRTDAEYFSGYAFNANKISDKVQFTVSSVQSCTATGKVFDIFALARARMEERAYAGMDKTTAAVTLAVLTGNTSGIESGLLANVRKGGIAHIFAVSGLHVGALYAFCLLVFSKTPLKRCLGVTRLLLLSGILFFYAGVCGFSASVLRACILCICGYLAKLLWIKTDFLDTLGAAAICILLCSPTALFEIGFQLSFSACLGIALLRAPVNNALEYACNGIGKILPKRKYTENELKLLAEGEMLPLSVGQRIVRACVSFLSVTIAAQIFTTPLLMNAFGYTSGWALLLNCIFVPIIGAAFAYLLLFMVIACLLPVGAASVILYIPSVLWSAVLILFEAVDFSSFLIEGAVSMPCMLVYYGGCTFLTDKWNIPKKWKWIAVLACALTFAFAIFASRMEIWAYAQAWQSGQNS